MKTDLRKSIWLLATLLIISFLPAGVVAQDDSTEVMTNAVETDFKVEDDQAGIRIVKYLGSGGEVTVPSMIDGKMVISIGDFAFSHCTSLKSIVLAEGIVTIGSDAFWGCTGLTTITMPEKLETIGPNAFWECSALESMTIPDTVKSIGSGAFARCDKLTSLALPGQVTTIDNYTFGSCSNLFKVVIPKTVVSIADNAFDSSPHIIIFGETDSYAQQYAAAHQLPFVDSALNCTYRTHVQNIGWQGWVGDGEMSGTSGQSLRLEGIEIKQNDETVDVGIEYRTHVQNIGWQDWVSDGEMSGTSGQSLRLEGIGIRLTGADAEDYDVYYQVHAQNVGWLDWAKNGESAGTSGLSYRLEGIRIVIFDKGAAAPGSTARPFIGNLTNDDFISKMDGLWYAYIEPTTHILYFTDRYCIDRTFAASLGQNLGGYYEVIETTENGGTIQINTCHLWKSTVWDYHPTDPMILEVNFDTPGDNRIIITQSGASDAPYDISSTNEWIAAKPLGGDLYEFPNVMFGELLETANVKLHDSNIEYHLDHNFTDFD
ncbi:leucine-rich repeat protein [Acetobacterium wieringae]|uniref:leucine-rich repeat protein n=1 Tax=Acetobacterium wieringae TaxID=52694 RepID=UPI0026EEB166|nr:leucine-rich repeat protein [Acetobacterium wieringae]